MYHNCARGSTLCYHVGMNENDLRVQRTRRLLHEAFIALANQHGYSQITIREITQAAQVGYKTFFRHYESKEALLTAVVENAITQFQQAALPSHEPNAVGKNTLMALHLAKENRQMYQAILNSPAATLLIQPVMAVAYRDAQQFLGPTSVPNTLIAHHFATSMLGFLNWWLENQANYSAEEMMGFVDQLLIQPLERLRTKRVKF